MINLKSATMASQDKQPQNGKTFSGGLPGGKTVMERRIRYIRDRNMRKAYTYLIISITLIASYGYYFFYPNLTQYLQAPAEVKRLESEIEEYEQVEIPKLEQERDLHKAAYDKQYSDVIQAIDEVFPAGIQKREIVYMFEEFAAQVHLTNPPFSFSAITVGRPVNGSEYVVTPISLTINSSTTAFEKFLDLVNYSGYMDQPERIRLMSVSNIRVRYNGYDEDTGQDNGVNFSVRLSVYSRPR